MTNEHQPPPTPTPDPGTNNLEQAAEDAQEDHDNTHQPDDDDSQGGKRSAASLLVQLAEETYTFGVSSAGDTFGVPKNGPRTTFMLRGGKTSLRAQLARRYWQTTGKAASQGALADALAVIEGISQDQPETELYLRAATADDGARWVDIGDHTGQAIRIDPNGWSIEPSAPMLFRRSALTAPLPTPTGGQGLEPLWKLLNVTPNDRPLVVAWLIAALFVEIPHPVLGVFGEQGTGKSTATKLLVSVVDPSPVPARKPPRDADSWVTAAAGSWVVALDNLSTIPAWLSDSLCRAVTGDGDVRRRLYTDGDLSVFSYRRCILLNGIDLGSIRGDLTDRLLPITLQRIPDTNRLEETDLWQTWKEAHPHIIGALLDLAVDTTKTLPDIQLETRPRMADFARILAAVDTILETNGLTHWLNKRGALAAEAIESDQFTDAITHTITEPWTGTASELLHQLPEPDHPSKGWPTNPRSATGQLRRWAPTLRQLGWTITDDNGANRSKVLQWHLTPPTPPPNDPEHLDLDLDLDLDPQETKEELSRIPPPQPPHPAKPQATTPPDPRDSRGVSAGPDPPSPRTPRLPRATTPPLTSPNGYAGVAGIEYRPSPHDTNPATRPCTRCHQPATDISQICTECLTARSRP